MASFEEIIRDYLNNEAKNDPAFAEKWEKRKANDNDAVKGCCSYIMSEAKKKAKNGCAVIEDAEVFGWAMHYIDEDIQEPKNAPKAKVETATTAELPKMAVSKPNPKPKAPKIDECQLSLF